MERFFANNRILLSRFFTILILTIIVISHPQFYSSVIYDIFFIIGNIFVVVGILGRIFASIFMSDNRNRNLVTTGLYSITRNPLYLFSFIATIGVCLVYGSIILTIIVTILYLIYYHYVIKFEQQDLSSKIGQPYIDYIHSNVPKFFPNFSLWQSPEYVNVSHKVVLQTILDAFWFFFVIIILRILLKLQCSAVIPVFLTIL